VSGRPPPHVSASDPMTAAVPSRPARSSRVLPFLLGLSLAAIGTAFCAWILISFVRVNRTYAWPEVPCLVTKSEVIAFQPVPDVAPRFRLEVDYFYEVGGRSFHSAKVRSRVRATTDRRRAEGWQARFPAGSEQTCRINPADPADAVLELDSRAMIYTIWFPGLFTVAGLVMAARALRRPPPGA
jgi:hypothetical protein